MPRTPLAKYMASQSYMQIYTSEKNLPNPPSTKSWQHASITTLKKTLKKWKKDFKECVTVVNIITLLTRCSCPDNVLYT